MADQKPAATEKKKEGKQRQTSAKKRDLQSEKRRLRNRSYRAEVSTAIRSLEDGIAQKEAPEALKLKLSTLFSLMDKGVKRGVYKVQKASRTKSRLAARMA
ncbi:MAG TPA: 30S ribosomal protein S20 [Chlamydiales bacterium]|jgi:small subunit ribosomal protein S20